MNDVCLECCTSNLGHKDRERKEYGNNDCCNEERFFHATLLEGGAAGVAAKGGSQTRLIPLYEDSDDEEY